MPMKQSITIIQKLQSKNMIDYKCSDFYCIKIPFYPKKLKVKGVIVNHEHPKYREKLQKMIEIHLAFKSKFLERIFDKPLTFFVDNYFLYHRECVEELLEICYSIKIIEGEGYYKYLIPIKYKNLIEWIKQNKPLKSKEPKKFYVNFLHFKTEFHYLPIAFQRSKELRTKYSSWPEPIELTKENIPKLD